MSAYSEFGLDDGRYFRVEVESESVGPGPAGFTDYTGVRVPVAAVKEQLAALGDAAQLTLSEFRHKLAPNEITVTLGVKFTAEGNVMFAKATAEASMEISLTWNEPTADDQRTLAP